MSDATAVSIGSADLSAKEVAIQIARNNKLGIDTSKINYDANKEQQLTDAEKAYLRLRDNTLTEEALIARPARKWMVRGLIREEEFGLLGGEWKSGKTMAAIHFACSIARGLPLIPRANGEPFGELVQPCSVLYVAAEGQGELADRVKAWELEHDSDNSFRDTSPHKALFFGESINWFSPAQLEGTKKFCEENKIRFIIVDTLASSLRGSGTTDAENNADQMTLLSENASSVAHHVGGSGFFVCHPPKGNPKGTRGSGASEASARFKIHVEKLEDGRRELELLWSNSCREGEKASFDIGSVVIGEDDKGRPLDAGVFRFADKSTRHVTPLSNQRQASLIAMSNALDGDNEIDRGTASEVLKAVGVKCPRSVLNGLHKEKYIEGIGRKGQTYSRYKLTDKGKFKAGHATLGEPLGNRLRSAEDEMARHKALNGVHPA